MIETQGLLAFAIAASIVVGAILAIAFEVHHDYIEPEPDYWRPPAEEDLDFIEALRATGGLPPWEETRKR